jgi:hypothetical protein
MTVPDWLAKRGGDLKPGSDGAVWYVLLSGQAHYAIAAVPVAGQFGSDIKQTNNGERFHNPAVYPSADAAILGGLDKLREALGW